MVSVIQLAASEGRSQCALLKCMETVTSWGHPHDGCSGLQDQHHHHRPSPTVFYGCPTVTPVYTILSSSMGVDESSLDKSKPPKEAMTPLKMT